MRACLTVRVHNRALGELEGFVCAFEAEHRIAAEDRARTLIVLEELFTNLLRYGYPGQVEPNGLAEVTLELEDDRLTIQFADDGQAFDPFAKPAPDLDLSVESRPVGGLGLVMIRRLTDEAHYSRCDGRNVIRLTRRVSIQRSP
jgi:anti-sigma regulatory factor (Ser/Thr protein kinase)